MTAATIATAAVATAAVATGMPAATTDPTDDTLSQRTSATSVRRRTAVHGNIPTKSETRQKATTSDALIAVRAVLTDPAVLADSRSAFNNISSIMRETTTRTSIMTPLKPSS
jgi:hypothetical protein